MKNLFTGELVCLGAPMPSIDAPLFSKWSRDTEYMRLLDTDPPTLASAKSLQDEFEKRLEDQTGHVFRIHTLAESKQIGFVGLFGFDWANGNSWVGIGIGEREYWGKGYGTEAMTLVLRYAFTELNLHRVSLGVFEFNARAIQSYTKAGFVVEGLERKFMNREGRRWDIINMGVLRDEWMKTYKGNFEK
ncbi:MAG: GNAT family N-acetyltransferase [Chloroflexi bacterium]|nr:GNAT family N-acetyltransferase [Chloroflexota bacterium]